MKTHNSVGERARHLLPLAACALTEDNSNYHGISIGEGVKYSLHYIKSERIWASTG